MQRDWWVTFNASAVDILLRMIELTNELLPSQNHIRKKWNTESVITYNGTLVTHNKHQSQSVTIVGLKVTNYPTYIPFIICVHVYPFAFQ